LFGEAAALGAIDGGGKGAMAVAIALSMITGRDLLGERVWRTGPVGIVTYEDDQVEWERRIAAACLHYNINYEAVIGSFHFFTRPGGRISFAAMGPHGVVFPDGDAIIAHLKRIGAALLIIDPFNHAHQLEDGNSNVAIAKVAGEVGRIARESGAAALVLHHLRKGSTGIADDLMGATSLRATFRSCRILARMTENEGKDLQLPRGQAWRHSRIAATKANFAPPPELATWFRLESVKLGNGDELYQDGDSVQVTTRWTPPSAFEGLALDTIAAIFADLRAGPGNGQFYSPDKRAKSWAGIVIVKVGGKSEKEAGSILNTWIKNGVLIKDRYENDHREEVARVTLSETKAAEILGALYTKPETDE
jgi:hypothetical protein